MKWSNLKGDFEPLSAHHFLNIIKIRPFCFKSHALSISDNNWKVVEESGQDRALQWNDQQQDGQAYREVTFEQTTGNHYVNKALNITFLSNYLNKALKITCLRNYLKKH